MELDYIRHFVVLAETGNYLEAADILFMAQSSLSRHIKSIEEDLGAPLFDRTTRKVVLNDFGKAFLPYAKKIVEIQDEYTRVLHGCLNGMTSTLTVASIPAMVNYNITDVLAGFQGENPEYRLNIIEADSTQIFQMIEEKRCECGFARDAEGLFREMRCVEFTSDHLVAVLSLEHPLAKKDFLTLEMLAGEKFLFLNKNTTMYTICYNACRKAGFEPDVGFTGLRGENLIDLAARGMGVALLTKKPIEHLAGSRVALVDVVPMVATSISLIYPAKGKLSDALKKFISYVQDYKK
ncbi:MAG: LysR family transcriptional regulator [Lachnospiraceae bacterium]|nr:LysR family transcriptional regulator [Lachnospiraceae bacterium]